MTFMAFSLKLNLNLKKNTGNILTYIIFKKIKNLNPKEFEI